MIAILVEFQSCACHCPSSRSPTFHGLLIAKFQLLCSCSELIHAKSCLSKALCRLLCFAGATKKNVESYSHVAGLHRSRHTADLPCSVVGESRGRKKGLTWRAVFLAVVARCAVSYKNLRSMPVLIELVDVDTDRKNVKNALKPVRPACTFESLLCLIVDR